MSAYLTFFELKQSPFDGKAQTQVVLGTKALREAFATIRAGLAEGAARICVGGGPGLGKTSLARALPKLLGDEARVAVVLDAGVSWGSLRSSLARQWGLEGTGLARASLLKASQASRLVVVIDQAEKASEEFLDHLDVVLSYRTESDEPVVQAVLLARLTAADGAEPPPLVWWLDRIQTLQLEFAPLPREGIESYIQKHLKRAGWRGEHLFSEEAALAIHGYTAGIPGEVSSLCERLLAKAAQHGIRSIHAEFVHEFCDPPDGRDPNWGLEDEFEELVLEEEFAGAEDHVGEDVTEVLTEENDPETAFASDPPSLSETLGHFDESDASGAEGEGDLGGAEDAWDGPDAETEPSRESPPPAMDAAEAFPQSTSLEDFLDGPATPEELRAIRGSFITRNLRSIAAATAAVVLVGVGLALFGSDDPPLGAVEGPAATPTALTPGAAPGATGSAEDPQPVLARVRGPVTSDSAIAPPAPDPVVALTPTPEAPSTVAPQQTPSRRPTPTRVDVPADWTDPAFLAKTGGRLERMVDPTLSEPEANGSKGEAASTNGSDPGTPAAIPPGASADESSPERFW